MSEKSSDAFKTISEVSELLEIPAHVLRFWETKFTTVRPLKRSGGRRYYRPDDVELLKRIRDLLHKEGYTIRGAQKHIGSRGQRQTAPGGAAVATAAPAASAAPAEVLADALGRLRSARISLGALKSRFES